MKANFNNKKIKIKSDHQILGEQLNAIEQTLSVIPRERLKEIIADYIAILDQDNILIGTDKQQNSHFIFGSVNRVLYVLPVIQATKIELRNFRKRELNKIAIEDKKLTRIALILSARCVLQVCNVPNRLSPRYPVFFSEEKQIFHRAAHIIGNIFMDMYMYNITHEHSAVYKYALKSDLLSIPIPYSETQFQKIITGKNGERLPNMKTINRDTVFENCTFVRLCEIFTCLFESLSYLCKEHHIDFESIMQQVGIDYSDQELKDIVKYHWVNSAGNFDRIFTNFKKIYSAYVKLCDQYHEAIEIPTINPSEIRCLLISSGKSARSQKRLKKIFKCSKTKTKYRLRVVNGLKKQNNDSCFSDTLWMKSLLDASSNLRGMNYASR